MVEWKIFIDILQACLALLMLIYVCVQSSENLRLNNNKNKNKYEVNKKIQWPPKKRLLIIHTGRGV